MSSTDQPPVKTVFFSLFRLSRGRIILHVILWVNTRSNNSVRSDISCMDISGFCGYEPCSFVESQSHRVRFIQPSDGCVTDPTNTQHTHAAVNTVLHTFVVVNTGTFTHATVNSAFSTEAEVNTSFFLQVTVVNEASFLSSH